MVNNEEDYESDNSVDTDELNEVNEEVYETKIKKAIAWRLSPLSSCVPWL